MGAIGLHKAVPSNNKRLTAWRDMPATPGQPKRNSLQP
jgi:hypothetical protein